jgi:hypothetical protein
MDDQWYQNYMLQLNENVELKKKIQELEGKLKAIQEILTGEKPGDTTFQPGSKSIWQKNKEEQQ